MTRRFSLPALSEVARLPSRGRLCGLGVDYSESAIALIEEIRPRLSGDFRKMTNDELIVDGIFLVARKP